MPEDHSLNAFIAALIVIRDGSHGAGTGDVVVIDPSNSARSGYIEPPTLNGNTTELRTDFEA